MPSNKLFGKIVGGFMVHDDPKKLKKKVDSLEGCRFELILSKEKKLRSNEENSYYWAVIIPHVIQGLYDAHGVWYTKNEVHEAMKMKFIGIQKVKIGNTHITKLPSTKKRSTIETEDYYKKIRIWSDEYLNTVIPLPNEDVSKWLN